MKKDYSEYQPTKAEQYQAVRSGNAQVALKVFHNTARFYPELRKFSIRVDPSYEFDEMQSFINEYYEDEESRGRTYSAGDLSEAEIEELHRDGEEENRILWETFYSKYRMSKSMPVERLQPYQTFSPEPLINIFSGVLVELNYGEGILDFIYADFLTPVKELLAFIDVFPKKLKRIMEDEGIPTTSGITHHESDPKIYNRTQEIVNAFFQYQATFSRIKKIAYASLYSAICPPRFEGKFDISKELLWYGNYLLALQQEYLELIEFCFDETFYPNVLGSLYPSERFSIYRRIKDLPLQSQRTELVDFSLTKMSGDTMPFGMSTEEYKKRLHEQLVITEEHEALAEKLGGSAFRMATLLHVPHFMNIAYSFGAIAEILELEFTKMLEQNVRFRKCKRCGKYFIMKGNYDTNYCDRIVAGTTRTCQELAAAENYKARTAGNKAIPIYNKYYKRYAARVRVHQIREEDFKRWKYKAIALRDECSAGKITVEAYIQWMEDSFPNRKKKP